MEPAAPAARHAASAQGGPIAGQQAYQLVHHVGTSGIADSLNHITSIAAVLAFAAGVLSLLLIRQKDFVDRSPQGRPGAEPHAQAVTAPRA